MDLLRPRILGAPIGGFAVAVVRHRHISDVSRWRAVAAARTPAMRMWRSDDDRRAIAYWIVAIQVGIVIPAAGVVIVAVAVGIVAPAWITGANEERGGEIASAISVSLAVAAGVATSDGRVVGIIGAGTEDESDGGTHCGKHQMAEDLMHETTTAREAGLFDGNFRKFEAVAPMG